MVIVVAIIGIILAGVLQGSKLVDSARVKKLQSDFREIPMYVMTYQDRFRAFPGDDSRASTNFAGGVNGNGSGAIDSNWNDSTGEALEFWHDLGLSGIMPGYSTGTEAVPTNAQGGRLGVTSYAKSPIVGLRGSYIICSDGIKGKYAKQMDSSMDDGVTQTGSLQVTNLGTVTGGSSLTGSQIDDEQTYLVCMGL